MNIEELGSVIALFEKSSLTSLKITDDKTSIEMAREQSTAPAAPVAAPAPQVVVNTTDAEKIETIVAPMVGTFYQSAHPGDKPLVSVGDTVDMDTTVCVLEAMKVFTEVPANLKGTITEILVQDGDFVEYGQPLFNVKTR